MLDGVHHSLSTSSISFSFSGRLVFAWAAISSNLAERRSVLADSTGPNTFFLSCWLLFFTELARLLFAMLKV